MDLFQNQMNIVREFIENEQFDELAVWMKKANSLHEIL